MTDQLDELMLRQTESKDAERKALANLANRVGFGAGLPREQLRAILAMIWLSTARGDTHHSGLALSVADELLEESEKWRKI